MESRTFPAVFLGALLLAGLVATASEATTGTVEGKVIEENGDPLAGATVSVTGPQGTSTTTTNDKGEYRFPFLSSGTYEVKVGHSGHSTVLVPDVAVVIDRRTILRFALPVSQAGAATVTSAPPRLDGKTASLAESYRIGGFVDALPLGRNVADIVTLAPGVVSGLGTGEGNYAIGGSSGLENAYVIDGVSLTDSGYGGVGTFSVNYGSLGTGLTTDFIEEIEVKTGGFEAEWGQALGGIVNGVVKTGGNDLAGALSLYARPNSLEGGRALVEIPTGTLRALEEEEYDVGAHAGGRFIADRLFWFVAYNPVRAEATLDAQHVANPIRKVAGSGAGDYPDRLVFPAAADGTTVDVERDRDNYAGKLSWYATPDHRIELVAFGDPADGTGRPALAAGALNLPYDSNGDGDVVPGVDAVFRPAGFADGGVRSALDYGADHQALRWEGSFGSTFFATVQASHKKNEFTEESVVDQHSYVDARPLLEWVTPVISGSPATVPFGVEIRAGGSGFVGPTTDETWDYQARFTKVAGSHEVRFGAGFTDVEYDQPSLRSGPETTLGLPMDTDGNSLTDTPIPVRTVSGASIQIRGGFLDCPGCFFGGGQPFYRVTRARLSPPAPEATAEELSVFAQDTWSITPRLAFRYGLRWTEMELVGSSGFTLPFTQLGTTTFSPSPSSFEPGRYEFPDEVAARLGVSFDVLGDGRSKLYASYGRYHERVPADLAVRAFSNEVNVSRFHFADPLLRLPCTAPRETFPGSGVLRPLPQGCPTSGNQVFFQGLAQTRVVDDTELPYVDELVVGYQHQLRPDLSFEVRGIYREQGTVLEDVQFASVEEIQNYYYGYYGYGFPFPGFGASPATTYVLSNPGRNTPGAGATTIETSGGGTTFLPGAVAFPFGEPEREYRALELILNRRFSDNWQLYANYRYSKLRGNYEGLFRNDNLQSDPHVSFLLDFPESPIMRGQYDPGALNSDRPHVLHLYGQYVFDNGFEAGGGFTWQSGVPRTSLLAHPSYLNRGELPGQDPLYFVPADCDGDGFADCWAKQSGSGLFLADYTDARRGSLGRTPDLATLDLHAGYAWNIRGTSLKAVLDVFNMFNSQEVTALDDHVEFIGGVPNPDFDKVVGYQAPRTVRLSARWSW